MIDSKTFTFRILLAVIGIALVVFGLKAAGYHIQGFSVVKSGSIEIKTLAEGAVVFIDNKKVSSGDENKLFQNISPGTHSILISKDAFWPWVKEDLVVASSETTIIAPFLVSRNVTGLVITREDPEYGTLRHQIANTKKPTRNTPLLSEDKNISLFVEGTSIVAVANGKETVVINSESEIRNVSFYKNRNDVVLMASQDGVFAIETDTRFKVQNFQPIYKGTASPQFVKDNDDTIYVLDGELLFLVSL